MVEQYRVKGSSIRSKFAFVREQFGPEAETKFRGSFDSALFPVLDGNWYEYGFYEQVIHEILSRFLDGKITRLEEVGSFSARSTLTTVYRFLVDKKDFVGFLKRAEKLHESCYNRGGMKVEVGEDSRSCTIELSAPIFREIDMHISAGFYAGAARLLGAENVRCRSTLLENRARFDICWD